MSYDLFNPSLALSRKYSRQFWAKALELALLYGWQQAGTRPPAWMHPSRLEAGWLGGYLTNDGQTVSAEDAYALAAALERSLDDIPDTAPGADWDFSVYARNEPPEWLSPGEREQVEEELQDGLLDLIGTHPLAFFAGDEKYHLVQFIKFCRLGSFKIS